MSVKSDLYSRENGVVAVQHIVINVVGVQHMLVTRLHSHIHMFLIENIVP